MHIRVDVPSQTLRAYRDNGSLLMSVPVSTARNGVGELADSECTPRGLHQVRARIGAGCPVNTVFRGRRPTGEIYSPALRRRFPGRDWILT